MDVFSTEHTSDHFPEMISPFPPSFDSFMPCSEAIREVSTSVKPQKLRPIRCNGKTKAFEFHSCGEFGGQSNLEEIKGGGSGELGFVSNLKYELQEGDESFRATEVLMPAVAEDMNNSRNVEIKRQDLPAYSSSSSEIEVSEDLLENAQASQNRKRRRTTQTLEYFMEKLASKILLKQEMMQNELMEMIERTERKRLMREEAWKKQELERLSREEQIRAQETAQNVALITLIKNIMDKDIQMGKASPIDNSSKYEAQVYQQKFD